MAGEHEDAFCWEGTNGSATATATAAEAGAPIVGPPAPPRRTRRWLAAGAAALVAVAVAATLLLALGSSEPQTVLARVADITSSEPGYHFTMTMDVSAGGQSFALNADGHFNSQPLSGTMTMSVAGRQISEVVVPPYVYMQIPSLSSSWQRLKLSALGTSSAGSSVDIQQTIAFLRTVGTVSTVGSEVIGSVPTTHYHADIDVNRLATALPVGQSSSSSDGLAALEQALGGSGLPLDVWVDAQSRVRRLTMSMQAAEASFTMTMQFSDYGPQPPVSAPTGPMHDLGSDSTPALID
jgi:hypothetical protein